MTGKGLKTGRGCALGEDEEAGLCLPVLPRLLNFLQSLRQIVASVLLGFDDDPGSRRSALGPQDDDVIPNLAVANDSRLITARLEDVTGFLCITLKHGTNRFL